MFEKVCLLTLSQRWEWFWKIHHLSNTYWQQVQHYQPWLHYSFINSTERLIFSKTDVSVSDAKLYVLYIPVRGFLSMHLLWSHVLPTVDGHGNLSHPLVRHLQSLHGVVWYLWLLQ